MSQRSLGDILVSLGTIDEYQLRSALAHHRQWGTPLGRVVVEKRFCTPSQLLGALSVQTGLPPIDLDHHPLDEKMAPMLSRKVAEQHRAVPLRLQGKRSEVLVVAIAAPALLPSLDAIRAISGKRQVVACVAADEAIERAISRLYGGEPAAPRVEAIPLETLRAAPANDDLLALPHPVLVYGWSEQASQTLVRLLASEGIDARIANVFEVLDCDPKDLLIAPLPALEALLPPGFKLPGHLLVAGKTPDIDLARARKLGAQGFLEAPLDFGLLLRAVRRFHPAKPNAA